MSEPNRALSQVPALLEERRKYESWLAALEQRRDATPPHVYERVRDDYRRRQKRVDDQLASFRDALEAERTDIASRLSEIKQEERGRLDERAELDLRVQVGELSAGDAGSAFRTLDDSLRQLGSERETLEGKIGALEKLFSSNVPTTAPPPEPSRAREPRTSSPVETFDELAFLSSVVDTKVTARVSPPPPASPPPQPPAPETEVRRSAPPRPAPAPAQEATVADVALPSPAAPQAPPVSDSDPRRAEPLVPRDEGGASLLTGVSGTAHSATHEAPASETLLKDLTSGNAAHRSETPPLSSKRQVSGATPLTMKSVTTAEQPKTLKCTECGAMNYPTEWYCERCGAELAAL